MDTTITKKVQLNLLGLDSNAFSIIGAFSRAARQQGWKQTEIDAVLKEARSGDYDHLLQTMIAHTESPDSEEEDIFGSDDDDDICEECGEDIYDCDC